MGSVGSVSVRNRVPENVVKEPKGDATHQDVWEWYKENENNVIHVVSEKKYDLLQNNLYLNTKKKDIADAIAQIESAGKQKGYTSNYILLSTYDTDTKIGKNDLNKFNGLGYTVIAKAPGGGYDHPKYDYLLKKQ